MAEQSDTSDLINGLVSLFASEGISKTRQGVIVRVRNQFVQIAALMGFTLARLDSPFWMRKAETANPFSRELNLKLPFDVEM